MVWWKTRKEVAETNKRAVWRKWKKVKHEFTGFTDNEDKTKPNKIPVVSFRTNFLES